LLEVLDHTETAMGGRLLRQWLAKPLTSDGAILDRLDAVASLLKNQEQARVVKTYLADIPDIERILSRLSVGIGNARDLINLKLALQKVLRIRSQLLNEKASLVQQITAAIVPEIQTVIDAIETTIVEEPPLVLKEGGLIKPNVHLKLDSLRKKVGGSKQWIAALETTEKQRTGITTLKVRYNKVFGFYIEVSKSYVNQIPENYIRKQTLVNGERFITPELKVQEEIVLRAEASINDLEYRLFQTLLRQTLEKITTMKDACQSIATLDCLISFAHVAEKYNYVRPKIIYSGEIAIQQGRHRVVEQVIDDVQFVPNDVLLNQQNQQLLVITGPNRAGKSVFIRQVALIVWMAQIGCFVPATAALTFNSPIIPTQPSDHQILPLPSTVIK